MQPLPPAIGRYEVRQRIGQGGMGALFLALDPAIDRLVALKVLRVDNEEMRARFLREARSAGRLQHPHIVTIYDVGEHQGQPFIAMEYVKGETLGEVIGRRASITMASKLTLMEDLCAGLDYAHNEGLVHRDIKPANLMVTSGVEGLKILDFGIARGAGDSGLTEVGTMIGTPNYMSPEQASGKTVDQRSDIFAVGAVIYEMLAYKQAFPGKEWQVVLQSILNESPAPLTQIDKGFDPRLSDIVTKALARNPTERYQSLRALGRDLADFREQVEVTDGDTTMPVPTVDQALELQPEAAVALDLRRTLVEAFEKRARRREREQLIERALTQAREALKAGAPEAALRAASEVLVWDPNHAEADTLKRQALKATEGRRRQEATDRKARQAIEAALREFEAGDHIAAFERLEPLRAGHPRVAETLAELRAKAVEVERGLESAEAVQQRSEEWVAEQLVAVRAAIDDERWDDAAAQVQELRARAPRTPDLPQLGDEIERGQLAARRHAEVERFIGDARRRKASEDYPGALARVDAALALWDDHAEALALREEIEQLAAVAEERREADAAAKRKAAQEAVNTWLAVADEALRAGRFDAALKALEDVDPGVTTATQTVRLRTLKHDAEARRAEALEEAARQRKERREQMRKRVDTQLGTAVAAARRASMDRRVQVGGGVLVILAVALWWMLPAGSPPASAVSSSPPPATRPVASPVVPPTPDRQSGVSAEAIVGAGVGGSPPAPATPEPSDIAAAEVAPADVEPTAEVAPPVDRVQTALTAVGELLVAREFADAFGRLDQLNQADRRVSRSRQQAESAWNEAAQETADQARQLSESGTFGDALALVEEFQPVQWFR